MLEFQYQQGSLKAQEELTITDNKKFFLIYYVTIYYI